MKTKIVKFASCMSALDFIKELHDKNEKCHGLLNCNSKERTIINGKTDKKETLTEYTWQVTYNPDLLKTKEKKKE